MNLFCFSLEGSMDSLYEPVPEQRAHQESASGGTDSHISPSGESGGARSRLFMEVSNFENAKPKRKSIQRSMSESKVFEGKTVNDTIWQEPSKHENDSHIRRLCQLKDLNEDDFLWNNNVHSMQGRKLQDISYQTRKPGGDPAESTGTLKRLQKLVWTKKARVTSLNEMKPMLMNLQDEDETLISCMKLVKSQEKKANNISQKSTEEMEIRLDSISAPLVRSSTSTGRSLAEMLSHNEGEVHMWNSWKPFPENPLWAYVDFQIDQVGAWDPCFHCSHHTCLKSSCTDTDLPHSWEPLIQDPCCLCTQGLITMEEGHMTTV